MKKRDFRPPPATFFTCQLICPVFVLMLKRSITDAKRKESPGTSRGSATTPDVLVAACTRAARNRVTFPALLRRASFSHRNFPVVASNMNIVVVGFP